MIGWLTFLFWAHGEASTSWRKSKRENGSQYISQEGGQGNKKRAGQVFFFMCPLPTTTHFP